MLPQLLVIPRLDGLHHVPSVLFPEAKHAWVINSHVRVAEQENSPVGPDWVDFLIYSGLELDVRPTAVHLICPSETLERTGLRILRLRTKMAIDEAKTSVIQDEAAGHYSFGSRLEAFVHCFLDDAEILDVSEDFAVAENAHQHTKKIHRMTVKCIRSSL